MQSLLVESTETFFYEMCKQQRTVHFKIAKPLAVHELTTLC